MSRSARRRFPAKRRLLEYWWSIQKRRRCARIKRVMKGTSVYFESLEPRVLLSGGVEGVLADPDLLAHQDFAKASVAAEIAFLEEAQETVLLDLSRLAESDPEMQPDLMNGAAMRELLFVDENVADYEQLISDLQQADDNRIIEAVVLESDWNGIEQVTQVLRERSNLSAVHFIVHGADGQINLGNTWLNNATLQENIDAISAWGNALTETGDILFYGCDIAVGSDGQSLLNTIYDLTGADVAASDDLTGSAALGGDWELEYATGPIETPVALSEIAQGAWSHLLADILVESNEPPFSDMTGTYDIRGSKTYQQSFSHTGSGNYTVNEIHLVLYRDVDAKNGGDVTLELRDAADNPLVPAMTGSISRVSLGTSPDWAIASLSSAATLTDGVTYLISIKGTGPPNRLFLGVDETGTYGGGSFNNDGTPEFGKDMAFRLVTTDKPVVDLNAGSIGQDVIVAFTEQTPRLIAPAVTITDANSTNLGSLTVTLAARPDGDAVESLSLNAAATTAAAGLSVSYTAATGALSITGSATVATYQTILQGIQYNNTSDAPTTTDRSVTVVVTDESANSSVPRISLITVTAVNDAPVGVPTITGTVTEDQTLTANTGGISDADGLGVFSYEWLRNGAVIAGATASTYTLGDADVGTQISVQVSYTDGQGTAESVTSAQTAAVANVNDAPVGLPTITGTVTEDQTLTANTGGVSDADDLGVFSYQWLRNGAVIAGATASTYTLGDADVGSQISVTVSYTDGQGTNESLTSAQTAAVANVNDAPTGLPTITGTVTEDQTLTANTGGVSDADDLGVFSYQWLRNGAVIAGATASTYTLGDADVGSQISVTVSYTDGQGTNESLTSAQTAAVANVNDAPIGFPTITGTVTEDQTLMANTGGVSDADGLGAFSYQWLRNGAVIAGATASTYTLGDADVGAQMSVTVSYTDGHGTAESLTSAQTAAVANVNDAPTGSVTITGTPTEDQTLKADTTAIADADGLGLFSYQWLRNGVAIGGATNSTYTLGDADVGTQIRVQVSYTDGHGTAETLTSAQTAPVANVNDAPIGFPTITGTVTEDQTLTADTSGISDADGLGAFSYQWLRGRVAIDGATASTYTLGDADVGSQISVRVSYTDGQGTNVSLTSAQTVSVANVNDVPVDVPPVTGTPPEDQTPTPVTSSISDAGGLGPLSYQQWLRNDANNAGGSGSPHTLLPKHTDASPNEPDKVSEREEIPKEEASKEIVPEESNPASNPPSEKRDVPSSPPIRTDFRSFLFPRESFRNTITARDERSTAAQEQDLRPEGFLSVMLARDYEYLGKSLDALKQEMTSEIKLSKVYLGSAIVSSIGLSVGYIVWLLRGGMLLASLLSSIPAWQFLDPLPILARKKDDDHSDDNESLESIVDKKPRQINPKKKTTDASSDAEVKRR